MFISKYNHNRVSINVERKMYLLLFLSEAYSYIIAIYIKFTIVMYFRNLDRCRVRIARGIYTEQSNNISCIRSSHLLIVTDFSVFIRSPSIIQMDLDEILISSFTHLPTYHAFMTVAPQISSTDNHAYRPNATA